MNLSLKTNKKPDLKARHAMRSLKWKSALPTIEERVRADEQNLANWNELGDVQYRAGDVAGASVSWQRALDGYAQESLHENVLGIGRKIAKRCPDETGVYRVISESLIGLEYYADAIAAFRNYVKLVKHSTGTEKKAWFRKIMTCEFRQPHLLEELSQLLEECALEDIELQRELNAFVGRMQEQTETSEKVDTPLVFETAENAEEEQFSANDDGLLTIESDWSNNGLSFVKQDSVSYQPLSTSSEPLSVPAEFELPDEVMMEDLPTGQGKDHYDLGVVYAEMRLWDAAINEFQTARRDRSIRGKATIELAQCLKNANDPHRALRLLEEESTATGEESDAQDDINYHMGVLNESLGNVESALACLQKVGTSSIHSTDAAARVVRLRS